MKERKGFLHPKCMLCRDQFTEDIDGERSCGFVLTRASRLPPLRTTAAQIADMTWLMLLYC